MVNKFFEYFRSFERATPNEIGLVNIRVFLNFFFLFKFSVLRQIYYPPASTRPVSRTLQKEKEKTNMSANDLQLHVCTSDARINQSMHDLVA